jgi:glycerol transport system ATP-binding protein
MLHLHNTCLAPDAEAFDHEFASGTLNVVLGRNRSGKTNLCRLIAGLDCSATGDVSIDGEAISALRPQARSVAVVFQAFVNYPNWTVAQNIASPMRAQGIARRDCQVRVSQLAEVLGLEALLNRLPSELSGGQQQRLAIARALAQQARVLLLDEPLVNLDYKLREALVLELQELLQQSDTTVIYTTTDPKDAFALGDRVLLLDAQSKLQTGTPLQVYQRPIDYVAADLMSDPGVNPLTTRATLVAAARHAAVRPEHVQLSADAQMGEFNTFDMDVLAKETSGDETFIHGLVDGNRWVIRRPGMVTVTPGQRLRLSVRADDIMQFGVA